MERLPDQLDSNARVLVRNNGTDVAARRAINFLGASNTITDDPINEEVEITLATSEWTTVRKASDESDTSTGIQDDNELFFTATSGVGYRLEIVIFATGAGDLICRFGEDTTISRGVLTGFGESTGGAPVQTQEFTGLNSGQQFTFNTESAGTVIHLSGQHVGAGGTFKMQWSCGTFTVNTTVKAGSYIQYRAVT